jgi:hypothetical protein
MKKVWIGFGVLIIASIAVYGVVAQVNNANSSQVVATENQTPGVCPFAKQTAAAGECPMSKSGCSEVEQTAAVKKDCCQNGAQTAAAEGSCCSQPSDDANQQTASAKKIP